MSTTAIGNNIHENIAPNTTENPAASEDNFEGPSFCGGGPADGGCPNSCSDVADVPVGGLEAWPD